jgi:hypothetical protein
MEEVTPPYSGAGQEDGAGPPEIAFRQLSSLFVAVQPPAGGTPDVADGVEGPRGNYYFLAYAGMDHLTGKFHFKLAFNQHDQLVNAVGKVLPALARRIDPQAAGIASAAPVIRHSRLVYRLFAGNFILPR